ncbi:MAG: hypothetical protein ACREL3_01360 [Gemmatimonadales bacterium]
MRSLLLWSAVIVLSACSGKTLHVESDTSWAGAVDQFGAVQGSGNAQYDLGDTHGLICWKIAKATSAGVLRVYSDDDTWFGLGSEIDGEASTTAPSGEVEGCSQ